MFNIVPPTVAADYYKLGHRPQYPFGTESVYSTWTPRGSRLEGVLSVVAYGYQGFIKQYLIEYFTNEFFKKPKEEAINEYKRIVKHTLFIEHPDVAHLEKLHDLGYVPLRIKAVKEGTLVPMRVPMLTVESTHKDFFWFTNYIETLMSTSIWQPTTSATIAREFRKILESWALKTTGNTEGVNWQLHDFSMRGMGAPESAMTSGAGHLTSFTGTDTIPAIVYVEKFYNANVENELIGGSVNATEHSVMCAYGKEDEYTAYNRLINEVYPEGILSIVSDTYDLWSVITNTIAEEKLKQSILNRNGKVVIRPDSGDPADILCGNPDGTSEAEFKGVVELLWDIFGGTINELGYKVLDPHIGAIYGDAITRERAEEICRRLAEKGFASTNVVFGVGSFTYQYNTRDTFMFALKATHVEVNGEERKIFKDPKTDNGTKRSQKGRVVVRKNEQGILEYKDDLTIAEQEKLEAEGWDELELIFENGKMIRDEKFSDIRERVLSTLAM
jgi:nicotinamide phosphoribosyltransferase